MRKVFALYKPAINQWKGKQNNCIILNTAAAAFPAAASASTPKEEPKITKQVSFFKEKTYHRVVGDLLEYQRKALDDLKAKLILKGEQVSTYGIPLLVDERSDIILLKFLRARDFKIEDPYTRIQNTIRQRKHNNVVDSLLGKDKYEKIFFAYGHDKKGRHVCYNVYSEFEKTFGESENTLWKDGKREAFFKWLVKFIEKIVDDDDDKNNKDDELINKGVNSILLVNDLNNFRRFDQGIDDYITIIQDNYPDFVVKQLCINTSWLDMAYYWIYWTVSDPTSKTKFAFASPSKTTDTLFKYIAPEQVPEQYGGLSKIGDENVLFSFADTVTQVTIKPNSAHSIEFTVTEATELVWELRVISWDVSYEAKFVPENEGVDTLNLSSLRNVLFSDQPVISGSFKTTEAGKVVITIDNQTSKKKKLLYRSKTDKVSSVR